MITLKGFAQRLEIQNQTEQEYLREVLRLNNLNSSL